MIETLKYHATSFDLTQEQTLLERAKKNPEEFAPLYNKYYEQIFRFIYKRSDDKDQAFDLTQFVFLKAINNLYKYEFRGVPFSSWLYRIAVSEINNFYRSQKKQRTVNIDSVAINSIIEELHETKIEHYHDKIVSIIAQQLNERELQLIEMRFFEKRSYKEIGEIVKISENNAKVKTYRVLEKLKQILK